MDLLALLCGAFFAVLFLQSGLDKVLDRAGNVAYFVEVTSRGPLRRWARASLNFLTLLEVLAGCLSAAGVLLWFLGEGKNALLLGGALLAALALLFLFAGQRLEAKSASGRP
jgi:uncharacterized membrane protein YphA (DoxX/SURF4 family)